MQPANSASPFPKGAFDREDESADHRFYTEPRLVVHIDEGAIAALRDVYARRIPDNARILDIMSSWRSHLPDSVVAAASAVVGQGMNAEELRANPQLTRWFVQDLNRNQTLALPDAAFDVVTCAVSVQYLTAPVEVFREINRVLAPGGQFIVSFSNRMFPTKAVRIWRSLDDEGHISLVTRYFQLAGGFDTPEVERHIKPAAAGWLDWFSGGDPLFAVIGKKPAPDTAAE